MTTELVAATTDEITAMTADEARDITDKIKAGAEAVWELITRAYMSRAWVALGYSSWDDYCTREFGTSRIRLPREERTEKVLSLRESGLSLRAIESATGISRPTIIKDLKTAEVVNSLPPEPPGAVTDSTPGNTDRVQAILEKVSAAQAAEPVDAETVPVVEPMPSTPTARNIAEGDELPSVPKIVGTDGKTYTTKKKTAKKKPEPVEALERNRSTSTFPIGTVDKETQQEDDQDDNLTLWSPDVTITITTDVDYEDLRPWTLSIYLHAEQGYNKDRTTDASAPGYALGLWLDDPDADPMLDLFGAIYFRLNPLILIGHMATWIAQEFQVDSIVVAEELLNAYKLWDWRLVP